MATAAVGVVLGARCEGDCVCDNAASGGGCRFPGSGGWDGRWLPFASLRGEARVRVVHARVCVGSRTNPPR